VSLLAGTGVSPSILNATRRTRALAFFALSSGAMGAAVLGAGFALTAMQMLAVVGSSQTVAGMVGYSSTLTSLLIGLALLAGGFWGIGTFRNMGRAAVTSSLRAIQARDSRPPILFLRAFRDDQVTTNKPAFRWIGRMLEGRRRQSLDEMLLEEGTPFGPVVALGNPNDPMPVYGAARGYFENATWREAVGRLADDAAAIVMCVDDTDGIWWEIDSIIVPHRVRKTLFLIHPKFHQNREGDALLAKLNERIARVDPEAAAQLSVSEGVPLGFFFDAKNGFHVAESGSFSAIAFLLAIRWFLRTRFERWDIRTYRSSLIDRIKDLLRDGFANRGRMLAAMLGVGLVAGVCWAAWLDFMPSPPRLYQDWATSDWGWALASGAIYAVLPAAAARCIARASWRTVAGVFLLAVLMRLVPWYRFLAYPVDIFLHPLALLLPANIVKAVGAGNWIIAQAISFALSAWLALAVFVRTFRRGEVWMICMLASIAGMLMFEVMSGPVPQIILWTAVAVSLAFGLNDPDRSEITQEPDEALARAV
jgi:hypothetical protein